MLNIKAPLARRHEQELQRIRLAYGEDIVTICYTIFKEIIIPLKQEPYLTLRIRRLSLRDILVAARHQRGLKTRTNICLHIPIQTAGQWSSQVVVAPR